jgi:transcriptional regulator with XRE-family HTH domain
VENTSLRSVAREIGMSPTGLKKFLQGTAPYSPTVRRLRNWYVQYAAVQAGEVHTQDATAALAVLVHDLSPDPRRSAASCVLDCVSRGYDQSGKTRPVWINELRAHYEAA